MAEAPKELRVPLGTWPVEEIFAVFPFREFWVYLGIFLV